MATVFKSKTTSQTGGTRNDNHPDTVLVRFLSVDRRRNRDQHFHLSCRFAMAQRTPEVSRYNL